jgi:hypothetical protein
LSKLPGFIDEKVENLTAIAAFIYIITSPFDTTAIYARGAVAAAMKMAGEFIEEICYFVR